MISYKLVSNVVLFYDSTHLEKIHQMMKTKTMVKIMPPYTRIASRRCLLSMTRNKLADTPILLSKVSIFRLAFRKVALCSVKFPSTLAPVSNNSSTIIPERRTDFIDPDSASYSPTSERKPSSSVTRRINSSRSFCSFCRLVSRKPNRCKLASS